MDICLQLVIMNKGMKSLSVMNAEKSKFSVAEMVEMSLLISNVMQDQFHVSGIAQMETD